MCNSFLHPHPLIPDPVPTPVDLPLAEPFIPPPPPAAVAPLPPVEYDVHHTDLPIVFLQDIPAPRLGEGTSGQPQVMTLLLQQLSL
ncbi:hypothetical protein Hanom_Chr06g00538871 [Helianthus anomalus]